MTNAAWSSPLYQQTALIVLSFLFLSAGFIYFFRKKNYFFVVSWASLSSWLIVAPILFLVFGAPDPAPLIVITTFAIFAAKVFFQLMGMYHRNYFVLICYAGILGLAWAISNRNMELYNLMPMIVMGASCLVPLVRNNYRQMIQYISLTQMCMVFLGWGFMHLALIAQFEGGLYQLMYLIILTEFCDNTNLAISKSMGNTQVFDRIERRRTLESTVIAGALTLAIAFAMRHLLPGSASEYWLPAGLVASVGGLIGDLVMTVVRRDAGIKVVGAFILGRGDFLHRIDRFIFVAPIYYFLMTWLPRISL